MMMGYGWGWWGWLLMVLFWAVIIGLAVWVIARLFPQVDGSAPSDRRADRQEESALEIARRRYAQGEISKAEYEEMSQVLVKQ